MNNGLYVVKFVKYYELGHNDFDVYLFSTYSMAKDFAKTLIDEYASFSDVNGEELDRIMNSFFNRDEVDDILYIEEKSLNSFVPI